MRVGDVLDALLRFPVSRAPGAGRRTFALQAKSTQSITTTVLLLFCVYYTVVYTILIYKQTLKHFRTEKTIKATLPAMKINNNKANPFNLN